MEGLLPTPSGVLDDSGYSVAPSQADKVSEILLEMESSVDQRGTAAQDLPAKQEYQRTVVTSSKSDGSEIRKRFSWPLLKHSNKEVLAPPLVKDVVASISGAKYEVLVATVLPTEASKSSTVPSSALDPLRPSSSRGPGLLDTPSSSSSQALSKLASKVRLIDGVVSRTLHREDFLPGFQPPDHLISSQLLFFYQMGICTLQASMQGPVKVHYDEY